jgi:hypothetical protein
VSAGGRLVRAASLAFLSSQARDREKLRSWESLEDTRGALASELGRRSVKAVFATVDERGESIVLRALTVDRWLQLRCCFCN